ncbi:MAG: nuclear transport factor 2 family protein [Pyrinomonadaceae bacterium]
MKKSAIIISVALAILTLSTGFFRQSDKPSKNVDSVLRTIHELCRAFETGDIERLKRNMTADFTLTSSDGTVTTLADEINDLRTAKAKYTTFKNVDMKPRLYGNTAVVTGKTVIKGTFNGQPIEAEFQFTDTLIWQGGRWWMVSSHASKLNQK